MESLDRSQLYERVWMTPMSKLAGEFGLSDRGLSKLCERHNIPRPPRGYWAKLEAGQAPKKIPLPKLAGDQRVFLPSPDPRRKALDTKLKASKGERDGAVSESGHALLPNAPSAVPHATLKRLARHLETRKPDMTAAGERAGPPYCGVRVSHSSVGRVVRLLSHLFDSGEAIGLIMTMSDEGMKAANATGSITFSLHEKTRQAPHELTAREKAEEARREKQLAARRRSHAWNEWEGIGLFSSQPRFDAIFTGALQFTIDSHISGVRRSWNDGKQQRLEELVGQMAEGLETQLIATRHQREERENWKRELQETQRRKDLFRQRKARETKRAEYLHHLLATQADIQNIEALLGLLSAPACEQSHAVRFEAWLQAKLDTSRNRLEWRSIEESLEHQALFPDPDPLYDPLGNPPVSHWE